MTREQLVYKLVRFGEMKERQRDKFWGMVDVDAFITENGNALCIYKHDGKDRLKVLYLGGERLTEYSYLQKPYILYDLDEIEEIEKRYDILSINYKCHFNF